MKSTGDDPIRSQRANAKQARAMTRAINMVSEEFIENFSQTGKDDGPDTAPKMSPVREALAAREERERQEEQKKAGKTEFRGFAALMASANNQTKGSAFARLLEDQPQASAPSALPAVGDSVAANLAFAPQMTADGAIIKIKETAGKKRGLYTSCMQRPSAEQMQAAAVKYARPGSPSPTSSPAPAQREDSTPCLTAPAAQVQAQAIRPEPASAPTASPQAKAQIRPSSQVRKPTPVQSKVACESTCPIACTVGQLGAIVKKFVGWCRSKFR